MKLLTAIIVLLGSMLMQTVKPALPVTPAQKASVTTQTVKPALPVIPAQNSHATTQTAKPTVASGKSALAAPVNAVSLFLPNGTAVAKCAFRNNLPVNCKLEAGHNLDDVMQAWYLASKHQGAK